MKGIASHHGENFYQGHYNAMLLKQNYWIKVDDNDNMVNIALNSNETNQPYLLFYEKGIGGVPEKMFNQSKKDPVKISSREVENQILHIR